MYGGTESGYAAYGCSQGWLHLLPSWAILEPVDADYQPTGPGVQSHTVLLTFPAADGIQKSTVQIAPLAFGSLVDRVPEVTGFQIVQTAPTRLLVRLATTPAADPALIQQQVHREMRRLLASYHLEHIGVDADSRPPLQAPGGKRRTVIPYGVG